MDGDIPKPWSGTKKKQKKIIIKLKVINALRSNGQKIFNQNI